VPNFVAIGQTDEEYGDFSIFHDGGRHLGFLEFRNFSSRYGQEAKLRPLPCSISWQLVKLLRIWQFFDFSKMAAVRHLGFVMRMF